ncbi:MAG: hypothetical protein VB045_01935, partial [Synergistaceae bacterium]|nr:hypothetical protein [Synergistaceae bacterium]
GDVFRRSHSGIRHGTSRSGAVCHDENLLFEFFPDQVFLEQKAFRSPKGGKILMIHCPEIYTGSFFSPKGGRGFFHFPPYYIPGRGFFNPGELFLLFFP